jgi:tetratricopeptide (TPR) repeat protein
MGDSLKHVGLNNEAMDVFDKLLKTSGGIAERNKILAAIADVECERGNYENAERMLQQITTSVPEHEKKIIPRNHKGKQNKKIIVKQSPQDSHIQKQINRIFGNVYFKKGLFDKAAQSYAKVLASGDDINDVAVIYRNHAQCLKALNSLPLAIANFRKAIEIYNSESQKYSVDVVIDSYRGLGDCLFDTKEYAEAIAMYKQSLAKQKGHSDELWSIYGIGRGYSELKNADMVNKTVSDMKSKGGEGFWSLLADYVVREFSWNDKYAVSQN